MDVEWIRAGLMSSAFLAIFALAELWRTLAAPSPELTRKFVHLGGGLLVLVFPWIFERGESVVVLCAAFAAMIWATRRLGLLRSVHGVERPSEGGVLYPLAVICVFLLTRDRPEIYLAAMLALILSDAAAAVLGALYGRTTYDVESDTRSLEGSAVFLLVTFLAIHLPLLLMTGVDRSLSVLWAVHIALVVTLLEGVSLRGFDNLTIPLATYYLLDRFCELPMSAVREHLLALLGILTVLSLVAWRSGILKASGVLSAGLFFYAVFALGGAGWMATPALGLLGLTAFRSYRGTYAAVPEAEFQVVATFYATTVGVVLLVANDLLPAVAFAPPWVRDSAAFLPLFSGVMVAQLGIIAMSQLKPFGPDNRLPPSLHEVVGLCGLSVTIVGASGLWAAGGLTLDSFTTVAALSYVASLAYWSARRFSVWPAVAPWNMRLQTASVALATAMVLPLHMFLLSR